MAKTKKAAAEKKARREPAPLARRMAARMADARALLLKVNGAADEVQAVTALAIALMRAEADGKVLAYTEALAHMRAAMVGTRKESGNLAGDQFQLDPAELGEVDETGTRIQVDPNGGGATVTAPVIDEAAVKAAERLDDSMGAEQDV